VTDAELRPGADFYAAIAKLRGAEKQIRKDLNKGIRDATRPIETKLKEAVLGLSSAAVGGGGGKQRREHLIGLSKTGRAPKHTGLRRNIARGITRKISYTGTRTGVRIRADGKYLPPSQKVLIKATNRGKVRHPVFADRETWVDQTFRPAGWFDNTIKIMAPKVAADIDVAAREALKKLQ
jgi:hypothetical protein